MTTGRCLLLGAIPFALLDPDITDITADQRYEHDRKTIIPVGSASTLGATITVASSWASAEKLINISIKPEKILFIAGSWSKVNGGYPSGPETLGQAGTTTS